jgi:hypothetical protein
MWSGDGGCDDAGLRADWHAWLPQIRPHLTPDPGVTRDTTPYSGTTFKKADLGGIPPRRESMGRQICIPCVTLGMLYRDCRVIRSRVQSSWSPVACLCCCCSSVLPRRGRAS